MPRLVPLRSHKRKIKDIQYKVKITVEHTASDQCAFPNNEIYWYKSLLLGNEFSYSK